MSAEQPRRFYIIAGEPSGDRLGGALMAAMQGRGNATFRGVGGVSMQSAGLRSEFDMAELTVMGLTEVLPRLPSLMRHIRETADDIVRHKPDALITIDSPDFSLRVAARARRQMPGLKVAHYVAPSVWAWRPGRAIKMARSVQHVMALLPFEPPYMRAAGMSCDFVGHPIAARVRPAPDAVEAFRRRRGFRPDQKVLLLAPGSRRGEVRRLMPEFLETIRLVRSEIPDLAVLCPVAETVWPQVHEALADLTGPLHLVGPESGPEDKELAFCAADAALCASGTVTLETAAMGTPTVSAYRTTWLTAEIVRRIVQVPTANLVNLITGREVVPEFLQDYCSPTALRDALMPLLTDETRIAEQRRAFDDVLRQLGRGGRSPADRAADSVLHFLTGAPPPVEPDELPALPGGNAQRRGRFRRLR